MPLRFSARPMTSTSFSSSTGSEAADVVLASRMKQMHHDHHGLAVSVLHVHLDHDNCLETVILSGPVSRVQGFADAIIVQKGARHGRLHIVPVTTIETAHSHGQSGRPHRHLHIESVS
jgi:CopG family nickel-responsive transcriptional regulator